MKRSSILFLFVAIFADFRSISTRSNLFDPDDDLQRATITPPLTAEEEANGQECANAVDSPILGAGTTTPSSSSSKAFIAALNGIWTSARCEISPGPEFTYRRYVFYISQDDSSYLLQNPSADISLRVFYRSLYFKFADPACQMPIFTYTSEGELSFPATKQLFQNTPGSEEVSDLNIYRVSVTIFNATAFKASNYSFLPAVQPWQDSPQVTPTSRSTSTDKPTTSDYEEYDDDDDEDARRERKETRYRPTCDMARLWPHLAEQLPILEANAKNNATANNLVLFEMYNELEPSNEWFHQPAYSSRPQTRIMAEAERSINQDRLSCLKQAGFNIDELWLLRLEKRRVYYEDADGPNWGNVTVLKTGQLFRGILGEINYKPQAYGTNMLYQYKQPVFMSSICPLCAALAQNDIEENCYAKFFANSASLFKTKGDVTVADASFVLPSLAPKPSPTLKEYDEELGQSQRWVSTRCETRPYGAFLMRQLIFSKTSSAYFRGLYLHFEDPFCSIPTYDIEIGGDFRLVRGIYNPFPGPSNTKPRYGGSSNSTAPFGAAYLFNSNWASIRPRNLNAVNMMKEHSYAGSCGRAGQWRLGEWHDVTQTKGCIPLGIRIPAEELQLIRMESSILGSIKGSFLYVGDAQSKRPLSPSLMIPSALSTTGFSIGSNVRESTSEEVRMGIDFGLFEQIRPTSFLEPLIKCRDLVNIYDEYIAKVATTKASNIRRPTTVKMETTLRTPVVPIGMVLPIETPEVYYFPGDATVGAGPALLANIDKDSDIEAAEDVKINDGRPPKENWADDAAAGSGPTTRQPTDRLKGAALSIFSVDIAHHIFVTAVFVFYCHFANHFVRL